MRTPRSTYRLQVTPDFDLYEAARRLPYLHDLGVDWVYLSPILQATDGSEHGYDVVDPTRVDESRGGPEGLAALSAEARRLGMGVLVDIVPNHMGVADPAQNRWWWDLLRLGRASAYADAFDVDWEAFGDRVLVPVLGDGGETPDTAQPRLERVERSLPAGVDQHPVDEPERVVTGRARGRPRGRQPLTGLEDLLDQHVGAAGEPGQVREVRARVEQAVRMVDAQPVDEILGEPAADLTVRLGEHPRLLDPEPGQRRDREEPPVVELAVAAAPRHQAGRGRRRAAGRGTADRAGGRTRP